MNIACSIIVLIVINIDQRIWSSKSLTYFSLYFFCLSMYNIEWQKLWTRSIYVCIRSKYNVNQVFRYYCMRRCLCSVKKISGTPLLDDINVLYNKYKVTRHIYIFLNTNVDKLYPNNYFCLGENVSHDLTAVRVA